ncbi:MAG: ROK family protein, partial [Candidatus Njordarchaeota archaeon]
MGLSDEKARFISKKKIRTKKRGTPLEFLENMCSAIDSLLSINEIDSIDAIGVGSIGPLDLRSGRILDTPNIEIKNIPVKDYLQKKYNTKCVIANDCTAAVIAEKFFS